MGDATVSGSARAPADDKSRLGSGRAALAQLGSFLLPAALLCLGIRKLLTASFVPGWQPISDPASVPTIAVTDALLLILFASLALVGPWRRVGFGGLAILLSLWIIVFQGPGVVARPLVVGIWLGVGEVGALIAASSLEVFGGDEARMHRRRRAIAYGAFGACCIIFGLSHFAYIDFTAQLVPAWLPGRLALAYVTGVAHVAAGVAIASGVLRRLAAILLAGMMGCFVLLVHVPAVIATAGSLAQVTFLFNACALCGSALLVARATNAIGRSGRQPIDRPAPR